MVLSRSILVVVVRGPPFPEGAMKFQGETVVGKAFLPWHILAPSILPHAPCSGSGLLGRSAAQRIS